MADTLKMVGRDMKTKEVDEEDVEDAVSEELSEQSCFDADRRR